MLHYYQNRDQRRRKLALRGKMSGAAATRRQPKGASPLSSSSLPPVSAPAVAGRIDGSNVSGVLDFNRGRETAQSTCTPCDTPAATIRRDPQAGHVGIRKKLASSTSLAATSSGLFTLLPHQTDAVERVLSVPTYGAILSDAVGLGKTMEVGEIVRRMLEERPDISVLILTKASQMARWEAELEDKFGLNFELYDEDFRIRAAKKWQSHKLVIASMDLVKPGGASASDAELKTHYDRLIAAPEWGAVIVDEAHHVTPPDGADDTLLFQLVNALRERTPRLLLLTGTPNNGDSERFRKLLKLARPDLSDRIDDPATFSQAVAETLIRSRKRDVTDASGNFLMKGFEAYLLQLAANQSYLDLERELDAFVGRSPLDDEYDCERKRTGLPIYRKLLASTVAALRAGLTRRQEGLGALVRARGRGPSRRWVRPEIAAAEAELEKLRALIRLCDRALPRDPKLALIHAAYEKFILGGRRKLLVFSEFLATQRWAVQELTALGLKVAVIHGEHSPEQREAAMTAFAADADVLVSTEAGAEGINLQHDCHIVISLDIPWNPMHIDQRIGRVDRLGQTHRVIALNVTVSSDYNDHVLMRSRQRAETIAAELRVLGSEYDDLYVDRLFGRPSTIEDIASMLYEAAGHSEIRTRDQIDAAMARARKS